MIVTVKIISGPCNLEYTVTINWKDVTRQNSVDQEHKMFWDHETMTQTKTRTADTYRLPWEHGY